jgi:hypothetical protein
MQRLNDKLFLSEKTDWDIVKRQLQLAWQGLTGAVNNIAEGRLSARYADTAAPTTRKWAQGDFVTNSAPVEAGSGGSKYIITGWICVTAGEPGTWKACRVLTGN